MSKLAELIAQEEGFNVPGSVPNRDNNPGNLRHSSHSFHNPGDPNGIGIIPTSAEGWEDLENQLQLFAARGLTLEQMIYIFAPPSENNSAAYLAFVANGLGCLPGTLVSDCLKIPGALS
ncbi:MAG TPA: hypothetical protein VMS08_03460 [Candidatus Saccharimonadia bacterium]|nr:hypothetical protein [Candidatus Saccharimonadia bacterium]